MGLSKYSYKYPVGATINRTGVPSKGSLKAIRDTVRVL